MTCEQDKIDSDGDGFVTLAEMRNWIKFTQDRYMSEDVEKQWAQHNHEGKEELGWEEYRQLVYGFMDEEGADEEESASYKSVQTIQFSAGMLKDRQLMVQVRT